MRLIKWELELLPLENTQAKKHTSNAEDVEITLFTQAKGFVLRADMVNQRKKEHITGKKSDLT